MDATTRALVATANPRSAMALPALPTSPSRPDLTAYSVYVWRFLRAPRSPWLKAALEAAAFVALLAALRVAGGIIDVPPADAAPPVGAASASARAATDIFFAAPVSLEFPFAPVAGIPQTTRFEAANADAIAVSPEPAPAPHAGPSRTPLPATGLLAYASDRLSDERDLVSGAAARAHKAIDLVIDRGGAVIAPAAKARAAVSATTGAIVSPVENVAVVAGATVAASVSPVAPAVSTVGGAVGTITHTVTPTIGTPTIGTPTIGGIGAALGLPR